MWYVEVVFGSLERKKLKRDVGCHVLFEVGGGGAVGGGRDGQRSSRAKHWSGVW